MPVDYSRSKPLQSTQLLSEPTRYSTAAVSARLLRPGALRSSWPLCHRIIRTHWSRVLSRRMKRVLATLRLRASLRRSFVVIANMRLINRAVWTQGAYVIAARRRDTLCTPRHMRALNRPDRATPHCAALRSIKMDSDSSALTNIKRKSAQSVNWPDKKHTSKAYYQGPDARTRVDNIFIQQVFYLIIFGVIGGNRFIFSAWLIR